MDGAEENVESEKLANARLEFFKCVESGDVTVVQEHIGQADNLESVINSEDDFGYTPLAIAIKLQNEELMKLLMSNGADPGDGMLIAVDVAFRNGIKYLYSHDRQLVNLAVLSKHFQFGTTPIMVACHNNNYELIEFLKSLGAVPIDEESSNIGQDGLQRSLYRLAVYKAICSPSYIMITHKDPLYQAFKMRTETARLSVIDEELSEEYKILTEKCEKFSEEYLSCCATDKELQCLLSMNNPNVDGEVNPPGGPVTRIMYAIITDQKRFVAHRFCQQAIDEAFTGGVPWRGQNIFVKICICILGILLLPFYWVLNVFIPPGVSFLQWFEVPLLKFASAFVGWLMLALVTTLNSVNFSSWVPDDNKDPSTYKDGAISSGLSWLCNVYIFFWLIGRAVEFIMQIVKLGLTSCFSDTWNRYDLYTMTLFFFSCIFYFAGGSSDDTYASLNDSMVQFYEITFSLGTLLALNKSIYWLGISESLGKLNILLGFAIGVIAKFFMIFFIFQFSFAVALNSLMWKENVMFGSRCAVERPEGSGSELGFNDCYYEIWESNAKQFTDVWGSLWVTFWALSGSVNYQLINQLYAGQYTVSITVALILWIAYCILGVLIFLNILIGLMFKSMEALEDQVEIDYKCDKAQMLIPFIAGGINPVPPPFNICPRVAHLVMIKDFIQKRRASKNKKGLPEVVSSTISRSDVLEMLDSVKACWRRDISSAGNNDNATSDQVKEIETWARKKLGDLDSTISSCEKYIDSAYKK